MNFKDKTKTALNRLGFDIRKLGKGSTRPRITVFEAYQHLAQVGVSPKTVIDVGVATGTEELYVNFPKSKLLLIEALDNYVPNLKNIVSRYDAEYVLGAATAERGETTFYLDPKCMDASSLLKHASEEESRDVALTVQTYRVDDLVEEKKLEGPYLLKIDVQGAELGVLRGAEKTLLETDVVCLEVSLFPFGGDGPEICEVMSFMKERGFVAYDIILGWNRPLDNALGQVDIFFSQENGFLRANQNIFG